MAGRVKCINCGDIKEQGDYVPIIDLKYCEKCKPKEPQRFEFNEVKLYRKALAITICEHTKCFECSQDAEHCEIVKQEMEARLDSARA